MRYAVYFAPPPDDPLHQAASLWLGRDAMTGRHHALPANNAFTTAQMEALTAEPRRYGFHATLKAPFELAAGCSEADLVGHLHGFAAGQTPLSLSSLVIGRLGAFYALVPGEPEPALQELADHVVDSFEPFRGPLSEADIARRQPALLTASQHAHLLAYGYPYVFSDFRFHMTLTGPVQEADRPAVHRLIDHHFDGLLGRRQAIAHLSLFVEAGRGEPFRLLAQAPLGAVSDRRPVP